MGGVGISSFADQHVCFSAEVRHATRFPIILLVLAAIMVYQGAIGYIQYNTGLPPLLVEAHMLGSGMFTWASLSLIERQLTLSSQKARALAQQRLATS